MVMETKMNTNGGQLHQQPVTPDANIGRKICKSGKPYGGGPKKGQKFLKVPDWEIEEHTKQCIYLISKKSYSMISIWRHFEELGLTKTHIEKIVKGAKETIAERCRISKETYLEEAINRLEGMIEDAKKAGNRKVEIEANKELNKIMGLHTQTIVHTGQVELPVTINLVAVSNEGALSRPIDITPKGIEQGDGSEDVS